MITLSLALVYFFAVKAKANATKCHDYKVSQQGIIKLAKITQDSFDQLAAVQYEHSSILYSKKDNAIQNKHIVVEKGVMENMKQLTATYRHRPIDGLRLDFKEKREEAHRVFEFLADETFVEWSLVEIQSGTQTRTQLYTTFRRNLEYFGAMRLYRIAPSTSVIDHILHIHSHPRFPSEALGKYAFPSEEDILFRDALLNKGMDSIEFKIRTDHSYVDYSSPKAWNRWSANQYAYF